MSGNVRLPTCSGPSPTTCSSATTYNEQPQKPQNKLFILVTLRPAEWAAFVKAFVKPL